MNLSHFPSTQSLSMTGNIAGAINLNSYKIVESLVHYGSITVLQNGSCHTTAPLPPSISSFILSLHPDISVWDGTHGHYGRNYSTHRPLTDTLTTQQMNDLREKYSILTDSATPSAVRNRLNKELDKLTRTHAQLHNSVVEAERKIDRLHKRRDALEIDEGQSEPVQDIEDKIVYLSEQLDQLKKVQSTLISRITQTEVELSESNTGVIRRIALLRRIFGEEPMRGGLLTQFCDNAEQVASEVNAADEESMRTSRLLFQAKCFYIDALEGKKHLYKVESTLKTILENLQDAMTSMSSTSSNPTMKRMPSRREGERGPDFRLRYVRRLWNGLDADFKAALPYIEKTSLQQVSADVGMEGEQQQTHSLSRQFSFSSPAGKGYGVFQPGAPILPSFKKIELSNALNKRGKIASLQRYAAHTYKQVNLVYDRQEDIVREALTLVQRRAQDDSRANILLVQRWEKLLGM